MDTLGGERPLTGAHFESRAAPMSLTISGRLASCLSVGFSQADRSPSWGVATFSVCHEARRRYRSLGRTGISGSTNPKVAGLSASSAAWG